MNDYLKLVEQIDDKIVLSLHDSKWYSWEYLNVLELLK